MAIKIVVILFIIAIIYSLASAMFTLVRDKGEGDRTVRRLSWRIGLSILLFIFLWVAYQLGWIEPNSGPVRMPTPAGQTDGEG
ncbi:MAG: twin transmembrane helix small protein [Xanthomonadales bacterium]|nr:twin transmembrane helix small protein [Xanthomonadales bacterium]